MTNAIKDVLGTEREADAILAKAQEERELEILTAKQKALQLIEQGKARIDARMDQQLQAHRKKLDAERQKILKEAAAAAEALDRAAKGKVARTAEALLRKFEQLVGRSAP